MALMDITHYKTGAVIDVDVCIVGSGAAGISVAREFLGTRASILVLEGGGEKYEATSQDCYRSLVVGFPHGGIHRGRMRVLGGTTTLWPGQLIPLFDVDFTERDWVPYSGWPIDRLTLSPYYRRAE